MFEDNLRGEGGVRDALSTILSYVLEAANRKPMLQVANTKCELYPIPNPKLRLLTTKQTRTNQNHVHWNPQ